MTEAENSPHISTLNQARQQLKQNIIDAESYAISNYFRSIMQDLPNGSLLELIHSGEVLCRFANLIKPGSIKIQTTQKYFFWMANHAAFIRFQKIHQIPDAFICNPSDILKDNPPQFAISSLCLGIAALAKCSHLQMNAKDLDLFSSALGQSIELHKVKELLAEHVEDEKVEVAASDQPPAVDDQKKSPVLMRDFALSTGPSMQQSPKKSAAQGDSALLEPGESQPLVLVETQVKQKDDQASQQVVQKTPEVLALSKADKYPEAVLQFEPILLEPPNEMLRTIRLRMAILGSAGCGKTSIAYRLRQRENIETKPTLGVDFYKIGFRARTISLKDVNIDLSIIDTAGMEKYGAMNAQSVRTVEYCCTVFALDDLHSFEVLPMWIEFILIHSPQCKIILIGNKCDTHRVVSVEQIQQFILQHNIERYVECSARAGHSIGKILNQLWIDPIESSTKLIQHKEVKQTGCC